MGPAAMGECARVCKRVQACACVRTCQTSQASRLRLCGKQELPAASPSTAGAGQGGFSQRWGGSSLGQTSSPGTGGTGGTLGQAQALSHYVQREGHGVGQAVGTGTGSDTTLRG